MEKIKEERFILNFEKFGIDIFEEFGRYKYGKAQVGLLPHSHNAIEFCYLSKGCQVYMVDGKSYQMRGGDLFFTFPGEMHSTGNLPEEKGVLYWFSLKKPVRGNNCLGLSYEESIEIYSRLIHLKNRLFRAADEVEDTLQQIIQTYLRGNDILNNIKMKCLLVLLLMKVIDCGEKLDQIGLYSASTSEIIKYINNNISEDFSLEDLADRCCLSLSRFKHRFKEETGMPPSEFISRKKIEKAQFLLKEENLSITDIAYNLGFSSSSYFSTVFKQYTGLSPLLYRKNLDRRLNKD